jgi:hypothetical protein
LRPAKAIYFDGIKHHHGLDLLVWIILRDDIRPQTAAFGGLIERIRKS